MKMQQTKQDAISSIHSFDNLAGHHLNDAHYMDVPSPRFSSVMGGEDVEEDEEKNEIIRCILHHDHQSLKEILVNTLLDITYIRDDMGYSLVHLSAYNNSEKCMEVLI